MNEEARFLISHFMTARLNKGYQTYPLNLICNEFTMKGNVRLCATRADVSLTYYFSYRRAKLFGRLSSHKHRTIQAITHRFQLWREHGAQASGSELTKRFSFGICTGLLELEDIRQGDDF
jgi:hypothetical protein